MLRGSLSRGSKAWYQEFRPWLIDSGRHPEAFSMPGLSLFGALQLLHATGLLVPFWGCEVVMGGGVNR